MYPIVEETTQQVVGQLVNQQVLGTTGEPVGDGNWYLSTYEIRLSPNPSTETINIGGAIMVDELVIDTQCVPEPSSLLVVGGSLLGLAGYAFKKRR